eukprot:CAMPEP_0178383528 /NCGR_PEP_ID=MMETSP0689_2-20121128/7048_1 /TAXON_ID=160604 /ORGANISM="Amphidinium massartii, Strain CS-259" /LENGTH=35 /DNA_ID= /DNA_START= /DNA_END= /DNA_ORIENTATION=
MAPAPEFFPPLHMTLAATLTPDIAGEATGTVGSES